MKAQLLRNRHLGLTLIEVAFIAAIMGVLSATWYASMGNAREKARQAVCFSHLRQIGQAVAIYRQDYSGSDAPGWPAEMGLPPNHVVLYKTSRTRGRHYLPKSSDILYCPDDPYPHAVASSYGWNPWESDDHLVPYSVRPPFPVVVARRGSNFPLMYDNHHNHQLRDRPQKNPFHILLRIDGRVQGRYTTETSSWEW